MVISSLFFISGVVVDDFDDFLSEAPELLLDLVSFYYFFSSLEVPVCLALPTFNASQSTIL